MLNVKYVVQQDEEGKKLSSSKSLMPNGNAWFINELVPVYNANDEIMALNSLEVKNKAVLIIPNLPIWRSLNILQILQRPLSLPIINPII